MALTAPAQIDRKDENISKLPMAVQKIYDGALVKINAAGYLANCAAEAGAVFAGVALQTVDNSAGSAGTLSMRVYKAGVFKLPLAGAAVTDVGSAVYATDENTITKTYAANKQRVGVIVAYEDSSNVWVKIMPSVFGNETAIVDATDAASVITQLNLALAVMRHHKMIQG